MTDVLLWADDHGRVIAKTPPGGMTAEQAQKDEALVPQDRPSFVVDNETLPDAPIRAWRISAEGIVNVDQEALAELTTPASITREQAMVELDALRKLDAAFEMAQQAGGLTYQRWFNARWEYEDFKVAPLDGMVAALQIDLRTFFVNASKR